MTGIERLRELAGGIRCVVKLYGVTSAEYDAEHGLSRSASGGYLHDVIGDIANQIEREQDKVAKTDWDTVRKVSADMADMVFMSATIDELLRDWSRKLNDATDGHVASDSHEARAPFSRMRVLAVVTDMERHVLGHEGMEDSPVARWARELREALAGHEDEEVEDVATIRAEAMEAWRWVREHGGLSHAKDIYHDFRAVVERLGIEWSESELHGLMDALDRRLMPEGVEWPRFEDGDPVRIGDKFVCWCGETNVVESVTIMEGRSVLNKSQSHAFVVSDGPFTAHGKCVKRPAPKVLDADGVEVEVGDDLYTVEGMLKFHVSAIDKKSGRIATEAMLALDKWADPKMYTQRAPVLAADGRPLREGETVWDTNGDELIVGALEDGGHTVTCRYVDVGDAIPVHGMWSPSDLTHERPVEDTWERLEEDCAKSDVDYCAERGLLDPSCDTVEGEGSTRHCTDCGCTCGEKMARDLVRRAKKLAGVSE